MSPRRQAPYLPRILPCHPTTTGSSRLDTHLRPERSAASRSPDGRRALRLLPPAASREGGRPLPGPPPPPPPPSGPGPRRGLRSPIYKPRAGAMATAGGDRAPTAARAGRNNTRSAARADGVLQGRGLGPGPKWESPALASSLSRRHPTTLLPASLFRPLLF